MSNQPLPPRDKPLAVGEIVPDFTLQTQDRAEWKLSDHVKQGDTVLCFFPFAFTGVCGTEMQCITREMDSWKAKGANVVGISCDSPFVLKAWAEKEQFKHTLLSDQHRRVCKGLGIYWADMNTTQRGTVIVGRNETGSGKVKFIQTRQPGNAMKWEEVVAVIS